MQEDEEIFLFVLRNEALYYNKRYMNKYGMQW